MAGNPGAYRPEQFFDSAAKNDVLQVVVFALIFAIALTQVSGKPKETMVNFFAGVSQVMFKFTGIVMKLAPFGVGRGHGSRRGQFRRGRP